MYFSIFLSLLFINTYSCYFNGSNIPTNNSSNLTCDSWLQEHLFVSSERHYFNLSLYLIQFDSFSDLKIDSNKQKCSNIVVSTEISLKLYARRRIFFESNFDLRHLIKMFNFSYEIQPYYENTLTFINLKGFNHPVNNNSSFKNEELVQIGRAHV